MGRKYGTKAKTHSTRERKFIQDVSQTGDIPGAVARVYAPIAKVPSALKVQGEMILEGARRKFVQALALHQGTPEDLARETMDIIHDPEVKAQVRVQAIRLALEVMVQSEDLPGKGGKDVKDEVIRMFVREREARGLPPVKGQKVVEAELVEEGKENDE